MEHHRPAAFGFSDAGEALAAFRRGDRNGLFQAQQAVVRFHSTDLGVIDADMLTLRAALRGRSASAGLGRFNAYCFPKAGFSCMRAPSET